MHIAIVLDKTIHKTIHKSFIYFFALFLTLSRGFTFYSLAAGVDINSVSGIKFLKLVKEYFQTLK